MKIGDLVHCTAYVQRTGHGINLFNNPFDEAADDAPCEMIVYFDTEKDEMASIPYSEFTEVTVDKFKTVEKEFDGIYVGTTHLATKLTAIYETPPYGNDYIRFESGCIKKFAVVYYGNNRKRIVPIECLKGG